MPGPAVFQDPAGPLKVLHTATEVDGEPQPKKLCAPRSSDPDCKAKVYRCSNCTEKCDHITTRKFIPAPHDYYDDDSDDEIEYGEYEGEKKGYSWNCMLGCCGDCSFDHGITKGFYVHKGCGACGKWGHWTYECSIKPTSSFIDELERAAAAKADMGEETDNTST